MKNLILLLLLILFSTNNMNCQEIFVVKANRNIYQLLPNGNLEYVLTVDGADLHGLTDISISPANKLYAATSQPSIIEINWETGDYEVLSTGLSISTNSLVCVNENELFYISAAKLYKYNIDSNSVTLISEIGYDTPGDVCIIKRNIIFPTLYDIKAYNIDTESLSTVYCFPKVQVHWGISSMYADCDSSIIILSNQRTSLDPDFLKIDLSTGISTPIEGDQPSSSRILGMATTEESLGMDCESFEFKDINCNEIVSTSNRPYDFNETTVFPNPTNQFIHIKGCNSSNEVVLYDSKGILLKMNLKIENEINISHLDDGIYFLSVKCEDTISFHKIIKH